MNLLERSKYYSVKQFRVRLTFYVGVMGMNKVLRKGMQMDNLGKGMRLAKALRQECSRETEGREAGGARQERVTDRGKEGICRPPRTSGQ